VFRALATAACLALLVGCPQPKPGTDRADTGAMIEDDAAQGTDATPADLGVDAGTIDDAGDERDAEPGDAPPGDSGPMISAPSAFGVTSGGGSASSPGYRLNAITGAPAPVGRAESTGYRVLLGTGQQGR
jgi:hypothetical protein